MFQFFLYFLLFLGSIASLWLLKDKASMDRDVQNKLKFFRVQFHLAELSGFTITVLMGIWLYLYMGGFVMRKDPARVFNWHPFLMTFGLVYSQGSSILIYRGFRYLPKKLLKFSHVGLHCLTLIAIAFALAAVFHAHNQHDPPIPHMYSLHSWLGMLAVFMFFLQFVLGFFVYLLRIGKDSLRIALMPYHIYFGLFGFVLSIACALMGLTEKAIFSIPDYKDYVHVGVVLNILGMLCVVFGGLVMHLVTASKYKRTPLPEEEAQVENQ